VDRSGKVG
jgi:hypothetical protein